MNMQLEMFGQPEPLKFVRHSETSKAAAIDNEPRAGTQRWRVLNVLRACPWGLTDHEMQEMLGMNPSTQRPRRIELVNAGLIKDSGRTRATQSGKQAVVWVVK